MKHFDLETENKVKNLLEKYPKKEAALLPILHIFNNKFGYLDDEIYTYISSLSGIPKSKIYSVASFYSMYNHKPIGRYHIQLCHNVSCMLAGSDDILSYICQKLNIKPNETTADGKFTLSLVECIGSCDKAPAMIINDEYFENLTFNKIDEIIDNLK